MLCGSAGRDDAGDGGEMSKCKDCVWMSDIKCKIGQRCVNPDKEWRTDLAMWKYPTTPACKAFTPKEEQKREETPMYEIDDTTMRIIKRLDRASMHVRALGEVEMSYDLDMAALKIKELFAKCASQEALIREKCQEK